MQLSDFDYQLPNELIAREPAEPRDHSRLMRVNRLTGKVSHHYFYELPALLSANDLLVMNNSKVLPARFFAKSQGNGKVEILLLRPSEHHPLEWKCLVRPGRRVREDTTTLTLPDGSTAQAHRQGDSFFIRFTELPDLPALYRWLDLHGSPPLPPYLNREAKASDKDRYQTVYAKSPGSVAAPTAGLHFTPSLLRELLARGISQKEVTLHVGYGTFSPVKEENIENHVMHEEFYTIPADLRGALKDTKARQGRVIAVGTTALRTLESIDRFGDSAETNLFIRPGYQFQLIDGLITNFHLPKSSLLILVAALIGLEAMKDCYELAKKEGYRFYSYGDAMLIL